MKEFIRQVSFFAVVVASLTIAENSSAAGGSENIPTAAVYSLEGNGLNQTLFSRCIGMGSISEVIELREGAEKSGIRKIPGRLVFPNIVCRRLLSSSLDLWNWRKQVEDGDINAARKDLSIVAYDQTFTEVARWNITRAWPVSINLISGSDLVTLPFEEIEIASELTTRTK